MDENSCIEIQNAEKYIDKIVNGPPIKKRAVCNIILKHDESKNVNRAHNLETQSVEGTNQACYIKSDAVSTTDSIKSDTVIPGKESGELTPCQELCVDCHNIYVGSSAMENGIRCESNLSVKKQNQEIESNLSTEQLRENETDEIGNTQHNYSLLTNDLIQPKIIQHPEPAENLEPSLSLMTLASEAAHQMNERKNTNFSSLHDLTGNVKNSSFPSLTPLHHLQPDNVCSTPITIGSQSVNPYLSHLHSSYAFAQGVSSNVHSSSNKNIPGDLHTSSLWTPYRHIVSNLFESDGGLNGSTNTPASTVLSTSTLSLNSSGEEVNNLSPPYLRVPQNTPTSCEVSNRSTLPAVSQLSKMVGSLEGMQYFLPVNGRENHNEKERKRRNRIRTSCQSLRCLVPGLTEKTDKATVFEYTVRYLVHLKENVGTKYDKVFMEKYSPY